MKFGYFFLGINQGELGSHGKVEIRPLATGFPTEAGARIVITVPLDTSHSEQPLSAISAHCLQSVQALLSESALEAWSAGWGSVALMQPTLPADANHLWNALEDEPAPTEPTQAETEARFRALGG